MNAVWRYDLEGVQLLISQGASPNYQSTWGCTPSTFVIRRFNDENEMLEILIAAGADVNCCEEDENESPLGLAAFCTMPKMTALLINAGANLYHVNNRGLTILMLVADGAIPSCIVEAYALGELIVEKMLIIPSEDQKMRLYTLLNCLKRNYPMNYSNFRHLSKSIFREMIKAENELRVRMELEKIEDGECMKQHLLKKYFRK